MKLMSWIRKILGEKEFSKLEEVKKFLSDTDSNIDFSKSGHILLERNDELQLWIVTSTKEIFIIKDNGNSHLVCIYRKEKAKIKDIGFNVIKEDNEPRLYINNTKTTLPINIGTTGGTLNFQTSFNNLINE